MAKMFAQDRDKTLDMIDLGLTSRYGYKTPTYPLIDLDFVTTKTLLMIWNVEHSGKFIVFAVETCLLSDLDRLESILLTPQFIPQS